MIHKQKRRLEAVIGEKAAGMLGAGAAGTLCALFSEAGYCSMENGEILMLHDSRYGSIHFGIGFEDAGCLLRAAGIMQGAPLAFAGDGIRAPDTGWHLSFYRKEAPLPPLFPPDSRRILSSVQLLAQLVSESGRGIAYDLWSMRRFISAGEAAPAGLCGNIYAKKAAGPVSRLLRACAECDGLGISAALCGLIGLGPGLTPSLDDWLTGFQYTLRFFSARCGAPGPWALMVGKALCTEWPSRTSAISGAYLKAAAEGGEIFLLESLLRLALAPGGEHELKNTALRLLQVGSHSGADMLTGVLFGLEFFFKNR